MIVYADVLIFLNTFVNFFILQLTSKICKDGYRLFRIITASMLGAVFSLYIFLPPLPFFLEALLKLVISAVIVLTCFGYDSLKGLIRRVAVFFLSSFLYGGIMLTIWTVLKPDNMAINNGVVYLDISPIILISATLISYLCLSIIRFFGKRQAAMGKRCDITIETELGKTKVAGLFDTGNSLTDSLTGKSVIIIEKGVAEKLFVELPTTENVMAGKVQNCTNFRVIPFSSVGGNGIITAFKPQKLVINFDDKQMSLENILIGISKEPLGSDYKAIVNPDILNNEI